jgi:molybdopterin synthase sulfur carrier subunit
VARVVFVSTQFDPYTKGLESVAVEAGTIFQLVRRLEERFPGIGREIETQTSIAVDGEVIQVWSNPLNEASEVTLFPKISGG